MFRSLLIGCAALVAGSSLAIGAPQDDLKAAAQKLSDASSYSWKSTTQNGGNNQGAPSEGKTEKDGFTMITMTRGDNTTVILRKGDKVAIKTADGTWKTPAEMTADNNGGNGGRNPGRFAAQAGRVLPAKNVEDLAADTTSITTTPDGFAGQLTEDGAKKALTFGGRRGGANAAAPEISNAKGDVKFMVKDGVLAGYELHVTGSISFNGNDRDVDRTTTVQIMDVGSTKVEVPDDAKKKLEE
jgi:hypothetical protein